MEFLQDFWADSYMRESGAVHKVLYKQDGTIVVKTKNWNITSEDLKILHNTAIVANPENMARYPELHSAVIKFDGTEYTTVHNLQDAFVALADPYPSTYSPTTSIVLSKSNSSSSYLFILGVWENITSNPDSEPNHNILANNSCLAWPLEDRGYNNYHLPH